MSETRTEAKKPVLKIKEGVVVSDKMDKTVIVAVERLMRHPLYRRVIRRTRRFKAHDETNDCRVGDRVRITECRPLSKEKCWRVSDVVTRAK
jgi:small subunit ribosomal protein S17